MKNSDSLDKKDTDGSLSSSKYEKSIFWGSLGLWVEEEASGLEVEGLERIMEIGCWSKSDEVEVEGFRFRGVPD